MNIMSSIKIQIGPFVGYLTEDKRYIPNRIKNDNFKYKKINKKIIKPNYK